MRISIVVQYRKCYKCTTIWGGEGEKINENRIFIQHEKDKVNFTWENFCLSEFVGLTSNKDLGIIIMPLNGNYFLFEGIANVKTFHILISVLLLVFMAF